MHPLYITSCIRSTYDHITHWGLRAVPGGERQVALQHTLLPVILAGECALTGAELGTVCTHSYQVPSCPVSNSQIGCSRMKKIISSNYSVQAQAVEKGRIGGASEGHLKA
jgi:hypothetical protein